MKKTATLKKKIKKKFGTYSKFTSLVKLDRYAFQRDFLVKESVEDWFFDNINALCTTLKDQSTKQALTKAKIASLKRALNEAGGVIAFCRENEGFSEHTLFQIIGGKYKTETKTVRKLLTTLNLTEDGEQG